MAKQPFAPRLIEPAENLVLSDKKEVTFRWSSEGDSLKRDFYDFRIYKGRDSVASNLILSQKTKNSIIKIPASKFTKGETYTWAVRQVYRTGEKSSRHFESFSI